MVTTNPTVDVNVPRFNQAAIATITGAAYVFQLRPLVGLAFLILAVSVAGGPRWAPLSRLYVSWVRPRLLRPGQIEVEDARPPRFAQTLGMIFLGLALLAFVAGWPILGWVFTLLVTALAALAAATRICVGCLIYTRWSR